MIPGAILTVLRGLPWKWIGIGAGVLGALWFVHHKGYQAGVDAVHVEWDASKAKAQAAADKLAKKNQAETERRYAAQQEIINEREREAAAARRDADDARAAGDSLRAQFLRLAAAGRATGDPGATAGGPATDATGDLLGNVQLRLDRAAEGLARYADEASAAGRACERSYDALTKVDR